MSKVSDDAITKMLRECNTGTPCYIAVREGEPFDAGIEPHVHIYMVVGRSESWIRKEIQGMDKSRKGNALYRMKKSHDNSPNYALKKVFEDTRGVAPVLVHPRVICHNGVTNELIERWRNQYDLYVADIKRSRAVRKKENKSFSLQVIDEVVEVAPSRNEFEYSQIENKVVMFTEMILAIYSREGRIMPTRTQMETLILSVMSKLKYDHYLINYYTRFLNFRAN